MEVQLSNRWNSILPVPFVNKIGLIFLGIVNCVFPGLGLALATCLQPGKINTYFLIIALCEFLMLFIIVGWIWAVVNGVFMIIAPFSKEWNIAKQKFEAEIAKDEQVINGGANPQPAQQNIVQQNQA